jgi:hypothetical protein
LQAGWDLADWTSSDLAALILLARHATGFRQFLGEQPGTSAGDGSQHPAPSLPGQTPIVR